MTLEEAEKAALSLIYLESKCQTCTPVGWCTGCLYRERYYKERGELAQKLGNDELVSKLIDVMRDRMQLDTLCLQKSDLIKKITSAENEIERSLLNRG